MIDCCDIKCKNKNLNRKRQEHRFFDCEQKPLKHGCEDNWTWSKRHRSQEVDLPEPSLRKGESSIKPDGSF